MKRLSRAGKLYQLRIKSLRELQYKKRKRKADRDREDKRGFITIALPEVMSIRHEAHRIKLIKALSAIRTTAKQGCQPIWLDMAHTSKFFVDGAILLYSELSRLKDIFGDRLKLKCTLPHNSKARQVLKQIGFLRMMSYNDNREIIPKDSDVVNWRCARGQGAEGEKYDDILGHYDGMITEALTGELFTGITEAMTNSNQHAYIEQRGDGLETDESYMPWWMFSQEKDGRLAVVLCDLGIGIPRTLPATRPGMIEQLKRRIGVPPKDSQVIGEAVQDSKSRTEDHWRGKGLGQIIETVSHYEGGKTMIFSNRGLYSKTGDRVQRTDFPSSICGTIVYWSLPISPVDQVTSP